MGATETQEVLFEHQEQFCCNDQVAQGGCGVSIFAGIQKLSGCSHGQLVLGGSA